MYLIATARKWTVTCAPAMLAFLASVADADELPKTFDFNHTLVASLNHATDWKELDFGDHGSAWVARWTNVALNEGGEGFRNNTTAECIGSGFHSADGELEGGGFCFSVDENGDAVYERWEFTGEGKGKGEYFGGTGKYAGIQCNHEFRRVARPEPSYDGTWNVIGNEFGTCSLP